MGEWDGAITFSETSNKLIKLVSHRRYGPIGEISYERGKWLYHCYAAAAKMNKVEMEDMWASTLAVIEKLELLQKITARITG